MTTATRYHTFNGKEYLTFSQVADYLCMTKYSFYNISRHFVLSRPREIGLSGRGFYVSMDQLDWWNNNRIGSNPAMSAMYTSQKSDATDGPQGMNSGSSDPEWMAWTDLMRVALNGLAAVGVAKFGMHGIPRSKDDAMRQIAHGLDAVNSMIEHM